MANARLSGAASHEDHDSHDSHANDDSHDSHANHDNHDPASDWATAGRGRATVSEGGGDRGAKPEASALAEAATAFAAEALAEAGRGVEAAAALGNEVLTEAADAWAEAATALAAEALAWAAEALAEAAGALTAGAAEHSDSDSDDSWGDWTAKGRRLATAGKGGAATGAGGDTRGGEPCDGAGDSDDSWGDWTAEGNEGATAAAALLPGLWAEVLERDRLARMQAGAAAVAKAAAEAAAVAAVYAAVDAKLTHQREVLGYGPNRAMAAFLGESKLEAKEARRRRAKEGRAQDLARAAELLAAERRLAAAKRRGLAATAAVAAAEGARRALTDSCFGRWERWEVQLHLHGAWKEEKAAFHELCDAHLAAALRTNAGWAATGKQRQLAAAQALAGAALPRELRSGAKAGARAEARLEAESGEARRRRLAGEEKDRLRLERWAEKRELANMRREDGASGRARRAWKAQDKRRTESRALAAVRATQAEEREERKRRRDKERGRLEEAAKKEAGERRGRRGTGAGRREDGPATKELKAHLAAEGAGGAAKKPKTVAVPRRAPFKEEVRDRRGGLLTFYNPREGNDAGLAQHFLGGDEVAEAWAEVAESDGSDG